MPATSGSFTPKNSAPEALRLGIFAVLTLTAYRVVLLAFATAELFVDEAQYWAWGQSLEFGYYSKPPLIGWVIRAFTELSGSDSAFWIRLPGPLFHGAAALIVLTIARRLWGDVAGAVTGIAYASMPGVALGALLFSTDTILLPFFALALLCYLRLTERSSVPLAIGMGVALGLGMMAKYAAIYFLMGGLFTALFVRDARISWRDAALAALAYLVIFAPNIFWNIANDLQTVSHTADNVDWINDPSARLRLNFAGLGEFFGGQFGVMGPVFFGAYLVIVVRTILRGGDWPTRWLIWFSLPIILLVCVQAVLSRAYANWAAPAYVAAIVLTAPWLFDRARRVYWVGLGINLALSLALPLAAVFASSWEINGRLVLARYVGRDAASAQILSAAEDAGLTDVVATSRDLLAGLTHVAKGSGIAIWSVPFKGHTPHYYAQRFPYPGGDSPAIYAGFEAAPPTCAPGVEVTELTRWTPDRGAYRDRTIVVWRVGPGCWDS